MTISTQQAQTTFLGNGATSTFTYNFVCDDAADFQMLLNNADGTQTFLLPSQYTLFLNPIATNSLHHVGGTVTYPTSGPPIADGVSLTASRVLPLVQLESISNQGDFAPQVTELGLDNNTMEIQQVSARTGRIVGIWQTGITYNYGDVVQDGINGADTENYYMCAIANLSGVWATDLAAGDWSLAINTQVIHGYAIAAAASAVSAAADAATATTEAGIAVGAATTATTEAGIATTAATTAAAAATTAAAAATSAAADAATAATQAGIATTQAGIATTQAGIATTQAGIATTEATDAAASALAAGSTLTATSTTSNTIGTGNFTFTTQANKNFFPGQFIVVASGADPANYMHGQVTSYSGTTLVMTESDNNGSGTHADWNISASGPQGLSGSGSGTVSSVSVASANGFAGTVANPTSTPAISVQTSVTGLLLGDGTGVSAATAGTDYVAPGGALGTPASGVATNLTGTAAGLTAGHVTTNANLTGDVTSAGNATTVAKIAGVSVGTPSGTGNVVMSNGATLVAPVLGTPASGVATNLTGTAAGLTAGHVTTNANLTGDITSVGNATTLATVNSNVGSFTSANITVNAKGLITAAATGAGGGGFTLGTPSAFNSASSYNITGLPAGIKQIIMNFSGVTVSAASNPLFRIGDATGGLKTTGYTATSSTVNTNGGTGGVVFTTGIGVYYTGSIFTTGSGFVTFNLLDATNFVWSASFAFGTSLGTQYGGGTVTLAGALDRITFTTVGGTATWTAGKINISYQ